ncbi:hypothetical protein TNCV_1876981 [Trichonephila clavipes]|nr:hypothetical protein TNCV_1876981 [Trichonephila clavipes]
MAFKYNFEIEAAEMSKDKNWTILYENPFWVPEVARKPAAANFRLLTGNDCLRCHLYKIGIADSHRTVLYVTLVSLLPLNIWTCTLY